MFKMGVKENDRKGLGGEGKCKAEEGVEWIEGKGIGLECNIYLQLLMGVILQYVAPLFAHLSFNCMFCVIRPSVHLSC